MPTPTRWSFPAPEQALLDDSVIRALGPLGVLGSDPSVTDVFVVGDGRVFADRGDGALMVTDLRLSADASVDLARALIEAGGRHLDEASPIVDVRLAEGIRVHAALPPVALGGAVLSIRFGRGPKPDIGALALGWSTAVRDRVLAAVDQRHTLLVTGATGSGKTTLLAALLAFASPRDRIVVIEDVSELRIDHPHVVQLECRQANLEGAGEVTLQRLVRESLRMRPGRLVVGECRGAELRDLLSALTTGHRGGAATMHAHSLEEVPARLDSLAALAGLTSEQLARQARSAFDLIIHVDHTPGKPREVTLGHFVGTAGGDLVVARI
ncbi:fimbriae subunit secretion ATPase [Pontimonas salivibrio]|uniref:Fimbriae subunit secretion ATPase n=1 Tax=Pontimonas salivibrio TaxID=1159327 RepID=A0A2L2BNZ1_9MICO|nr:ATPase, T2SS/T4P/T4SS family [Pontimonas salivibrio]AVG23386.1 fimbriae subunit secretion ATPase [Pontimonas salivibrio]